MKSVPRSSPPNVQALTWGTGSTMSSRTAPDGSNPRTRLPPHSATQTLPSAATVRPSGTPSSSGMCANTRRPRRSPSATSNTSIRPVSVST